MSTRQNLETTTDRSSRQAAKEQAHAERRDRQTILATLSLQAGWTEDKRAALFVFNEAGTPGADMRLPIWEGIEVHPLYESARAEALDVAVEGLRQLFYGSSSAPREGHAADH
ncbi:MAG: hypothetical protein ACXVXD_16230 [Nocardioidaceae bacterium]